MLAVMMRHGERSWARISLIFAVCAACAIGRVRVALADEEPEVLIRQGVEMRKRGDDVKAHGYFQRAYDIAHTPRSAAQLGLADLAVDDNLAAELHLSEALASIDPWIAQNRSVLEKSRETARGELGKVIVKGAPAATTVEIAGRATSLVPSDGIIWVPPGGADLRFSAPNRQPASKKVTAAKRASTTLEIDLPVIPGAPGPASGSTSAEAGHTETPAPEQPPGPPPPPPPPPTEPPARPWQVTTAWVAGGVGVALVAAGVTAQLLYASKVNQFNDVTNAPNPSGHCDTALPNNGGGPCQSLIDAANTRSTLATIGFVAGGLAIAGSAVLYLTAPHGATHHDMAAACAPSREASGVSCALSLTF
jgi:hypothetical protein